MKMFQMDANAVLVGLLAAGTWSAMNHSLLDGVVVGFLAGGLFGAGRIFLKRLKKKRKWSAIKEGLVGALMDVEVLLSLQWPFERALEECMKEDSQNAFWQWYSNEWNAAKADQVARVLERLANQTNDLEILDALGQLELAYHSTKKKEKGFGLHAYALFLLQRQRLAKKTQGKKMALVSVLFVMTGSVIPGLLQSFLLVGSAFLDLSIAPETVFWLLVAGIPLVNVALLALAVDQFYSTEGL